MTKDRYEKPEVNKIVLTYDESVLQYCKIDAAGGPLATGCLATATDPCYDHGS